MACHIALSRKVLNKPEFCQTVEIQNPRVLAHLSTKLHEIFKSRCPRGAQFNNTECSPKMFPGSPRAPGGQIQTPSLICPLSPSHVGFLNKSFGEPLGPQRQSKEHRVSSSIIHKARGEVSCLAEWCESGRQGKTEMPQRNAVAQLEREETVESTWDRELELEEVQTAFQISSIEGCWPSVFLSH